MKRIRLMSHTADHSTTQTVVLHVRRGRTQIPYLNMIYVVPALQPRALPFSRRRTFPPLRLSDSCGYFAGLDLIFLIIIIPFILLCFYLCLCFSSVFVTNFSFISCRFFLFVPFHFIRSVSCFLSIFHHFCSVV